MKKILAMSTFCVDIYPDKNTYHVGGNALNLAVNCAKTGNAEVYLMGSVGNDAYGEQIREAAVLHNLNHTHLYTIEGETASNKVYLTETGDRYFKNDSWTDGVIRKFKISPNDEKLIREVDAVATTLNDGLILAIAEAKPQLLSVDFMEHTPSDKWSEYFSVIDLFFISADKSGLFSTSDNLLKKWSCEYPDVVFVATLGANGSIAFKNDEEFHCEAVKVDEVVDTTGCGDSYQGAFIVEYLNSGDISAAMKAGAKSASITLSHVGAI